MGCNFDFVCSPGHIIESGSCMESILLFWQEVAARGGKTQKKFLVFHHALCDAFGYKVGSC